MDLDLATRPTICRLVAGIINVESGHGRWVAGRALLAGLDAPTPGPRGRA